MSRWKSPQAAAKRTEHMAKEAEQRRNEKRKSWLLIVGVAVASVGLVVADYFWLRHQARQRHEQRHRHSMQSNSPALPVGLPGEMNPPKQNE